MLSLVFVESNKKTTENKKEKVGTQVKKNQKKEEPHLWIFSLYNMQFRLKLDFLIFHLACNVDQNLNWT